MRKDPSRRLDEIADARIAIEDFLENPEAVAGSAVAAQDRPAWRAALPWSVSALAVVAAAALGIGLGGYGFPDYDVAPDGRRFVMFPQETEQLRLGQETLVTRWFDELGALPNR